MSRRSKRRDGSRGRLAAPRRAARPREAGVWCSYVFTIGANGGQMGAFFQNGHAWTSCDFAHGLRSERVGMDFVAHPSPREAVANCQRLLALGWTPMDASDIEATTGVTIGPETELKAVAKRADMCAVM